MWDFLGSSIGALASIYGANKSAETATQNMQEQAAINQMNLAEQEKFAQNSIQWKVADAKAAGINPLAALGAPTSSFSNLVAPQNTSNAGELYAKAGQSFGRAISSLQSAEDRQKSEAADALKLENQSLQNDLLRSQITRVHQEAVAPPVPSMTEGSGLGVKPGVGPDVERVVTPSGDQAVVPPKEISQLGFFHPASLSWYARNGLGPAFGYNVPKGNEGDYYNPFLMTYSKDAWYNSPFSGPERTSTVGRYLDRYRWLPGDW